MQGKKDLSADLKRNLQNFERLIAQFPIKTGDYWTVLLDYFRVCPYVQSLDFNWKKISLDWPEQPPHEVVPYWVCTNYKNCAHNEQCHPPFRWADTAHGCDSINNQDIRFALRTTTTAGKEKTSIHKLTVGQAIIKSSGKVLASPERLRSMRERHQYSQDQIANMCGVSKQTISDLETIDALPKYKLNQIATENKLVIIQYSLCCLLAVLYEVKPGYLMGQSDATDRDVNVNKRTYYKISDISCLKNHKGKPGLERRPISDIMKIPCVHEEYEVSPSARDAILLFGDAKRKGRLAADRLRKHYDSLDPDFQKLLELCERIYYQPISQDFRLLLEGLLDDINTLDGEPGIHGDFAQP